MSTQYAQGISLHAPRVGCQGVGSAVGGKGAGRGSVGSNIAATAKVAAAISTTRVEDKPIGLEEDTQLAKAKL